jgi:hypothetical protein
MKLQTITDEAQLTDSRGWTYKEDGHTPSYDMPQIMNLLYEHELGEELEWDELARLASYVCKVERCENLSPDRLSELWEECEDNYQGDYPTEAEFAEEFMHSAGWVDEVATSHLVIDWAQTYDYSLQHDYFNVYLYARNHTIEGFDGLKAFRHFWRNV